MKLTTSNLKIIQNLPVLKDTDKDKILLVACGQKPTTSYHFILSDPKLDNNFPIPTIKREEQLKEIVNNLLEIGLLVNLSERAHAFGAPDVHFLQFIMIAQKQEDLDELSEINRAIIHDELIIDPKRRMGRLFGYPRTAIEAFVNGDKLIEKTDLPEEVLNSDYIRYLDFRLSAQNYKEELEVVKRWSALL